MKTFIKLFTAILVGGLLFGQVTSIPTATGGGASTFDNIGSGTNTSATLTCGAGCTLVTTAGIFRLPNGTSAPGTCTVGDAFFDTDATAGSNMYGCTATNTWTLLGGTGTELKSAATSGGDNRVMRSVADSRNFEGTTVQITDTNQVSAPGGFVAGDGTVAGESQHYELTANGTDYASWLAPDSITTTQRLKLPAAANTANQTLKFGSPASNISTATWDYPLWRNTGTSLPGTCTVGESFQKTDATASAQWYLCTATNTWTAQGGGASVTKVAQSVAFWSKTYGSSGGQTAGCTGSGGVGTSYDFNNAASLTFPDSGTPTIICTVLIPEDWDGGVVSLTGVYIGNTAVGGDKVQMEFATDCAADGTSYPPSFGSDTEINFTSLSTNANMAHKTTTSITLDAGCAENRLMYVRLRRDTASADDDRSATWHLIQAQISFLVNLQ